MRRHVVGVIRPLHAPENGALDDVGVEAHDGHGPVRSEAAAPHGDAVVAQGLPHVIDVRRSLDDGEPFEVQPLPGPEGLLTRRGGPHAFGALRFGGGLVERKRARALDQRRGFRRPDAALADHHDVGRIQQRADALS